MKESEKGSPTEEVEHNVDEFNSVASCCCCSSSSGRLRLTGAPSTSIFARAFEFSRASIIALALVPDACCSGENDEIALFIGGGGGGGRAELAISNDEIGFVSMPARASWDGSSGKLPVPAVLMRGLRPEN